MNTICGLKVFRIDKLEEISMEILVILLEKLLILGEKFREIDENKAALTLLYFRHFVSSSD